MSDDQEPGEGLPRSAVALLFPFVLYAVAGIGMVITWLVVSFR